LEVSIFEFIFIHTLVSIESETDEDKSIFSQNDYYLVTLFASDYYFFTYVVMSLYVSHVTSYFKKIY